MSLTLFILIGLVLQIALYFICVRRIQQLTSIFPDIQLLKVFEKYVPKEWLKQLTPDRIVLEALKPKSESGSKLENAFATSLQERIIFLKADKNFSTPFKERNHRWD